MAALLHCLKTHKPAGHPAGLHSIGIERREVEKRIYGEERERLTASATFLLLEYLGDLNGK